MNNIYSFKAGERIYAFGECGPAYRVMSGSIRIDRVLQDSPSSFANVAVVGDLFGAEVLLNQTYGFEARALTDCEVMVWEAPKQSWLESFARELIQISERQAEAVSLRSGTALERIIKLINLMRHNQDDDRTVLPSNKDISEMTCLTTETASRCITQLRSQGILTPLNVIRGAKKRYFKVSSIPMNQMSA